MIDAKNKYQVEDVLVVEEPDEVEGPEGGGGTERQVPDHQRAEQNLLFLVVSLSDEVLTCRTTTA